MKLAEILTGPETWCKVDFETKDGRYCLLGAVIHLERLHGTNRAHAECRRLNRVLAALHPEAGWGAMLWNDAKARTWDDIPAVVEAYDRDRMLNP